MTDCACLTGEATAVNVSNDVELADSLGNAEGLIYDELEGLKAKVIFNVSAVDGDSTGTGVETYSCYRLLSSACAVEIRTYLFEN